MIDEIVANDHEKIIFDFDNSRVKITRSEGLAKYGWPDLDIPFSCITGIEYSKPGFMRDGGVIFIINNTRLLKNISKTDVNVVSCTFVKQKNDQIYSDIEKLSELLNVPIKGRMEFDVTKAIYDESKEISLQGNFFTEYRKRCNVCGKVFCYTQGDLERNNKLANEALSSGIMALGEAFAGTSVGFYGATAQADRELGKIVDYNRCPDCGSLDLVDISEDEYRKQLASGNNQKAISSVADELKQFKELLDSGIITQEEFDTKKKQLLGL